MEWRETIKDGVLAWNEAFEKLGLGMLLEVKVQPDDAEWDAGDIRYNVLRGLLRQILWRLWPKYD